MLRPHRILLYLSIILPIFLAVGATSWLSLKRGDRIVSEAAVELHDDISHQVEQRMYSYLAIPRIVNRILAQRLNDEKAISLSNQKDIQKALQSVQIRQAIELVRATPISIIKYISQKGEYIGIGKLPGGLITLQEVKNKDLYVYSIDQNHLNKPFKLSRVQLNYDPRNRPWYQAALKRKKGVWSSIDIDPFFHQLSITFSEPIYNNQGQLLGVKGTTLLLKDISQFLKTLKIGKTGTALIIDRNRQIIATSENPEIILNDETNLYSRPFLQDINPELNKVLNIEKIQNTELLQATILGENQFIQISPVQDDYGLNWLLITKFSEKEFKNIYNKNLKFTLLLCLMILILSSIFVMLSSYLIINPILTILDSRLDRLTGLPNRYILIKEIEKAIKKNLKFAVLILNLNRFGEINNSLGNQVGDQLLITVAERLKTCLNSTDMVARLEGYEFAILTLNTPQAEQAIEKAEEIEGELNQAFLINHNQIFIKFKLGIAFSNLDYQEPDHLLRDANMAMEQAKKSRRDLHKVFDPSIHQNIVALWKLESELKTAIINNEFFLNYQPIVSLDHQEIIGVEALIRWRHSEKGIISPTNFIPVAEETGMILDLGLWVLKEACKEFVQWQYPIKLTVNLSPQQIYQPHFIEKVDEILEQFGMSSNLLKFEVTEGAIIENIDLAQEIFEQFKARGIQLSIDDFGTGYCSLSYLNKFLFDTLKLDRSFVQMGKSEITETIIILAHKLGMEVVAEGIETEQQKRYLKALNCEYGQGYLFYRPLDGATILELLQNQDLRDE